MKILIFTINVLLKFLVGFESILKMAWRLSATHHARWMRTCIYILKIVLCSDFFKVGAQQMADLLVLCFYIIYVHFWYRMSCPVLADAPFLTLSLHRDLTA